MIRWALEVQRNALPSGHPETALSMWHPAETLRNLRQLEEAESFGGQALQIWEEQFGAQHEWTGWGVISLAQTRMAQGVAAEAATLAQRAVALIGSLYGPEHAVLATALVLQGRALLELSMPHAAEPVLTRALLIQPADGRDTGADTCVVLHRLGFDLLTASDTRCHPAAGARRPIGS
jgi:hypothetical protein